MRLKYVVASHANAQGGGLAETSMIFYDKEFALTFIRENLARNTERGRHYKLYELVEIPLITEHIPARIKVEVAR